MAVPTATGIDRTDLHQHDLSAPGREVVQHRVEISPEAPRIRHKHPGEVKNVGSGSAGKLATTVVEKGKPLVVVVE